MKRYLAPAILLLGSYHATGQVTFDEKLHFGAGIVAGAAGGFVAHKISKGDKWWTIAGAVGTSLVAGAAKEAIDQVQDGDWDNRELAATALGGVVVGVTIEIFHGKNRKKRQQRMQAASPDPGMESMIYGVPLPGNLNPGLGSKP